MTSTVREGAERPPARPAWSGAAGAGAVLILLAQLVWRGVYLSRGYFTQDDFLMFHLSAGRPLNADLLSHDYSGHLFPGGFAIAWLQAHLAPLDWGVAYVYVAAMQLAAGSLAWLVLCRLLGDRWERLPILAVFCFAPLSLWSTQWWAVAIQFLPVEICALGAVLAYLAYRQSRWRHGGVVVGGLTALSLCFQERGILIPLMVFGVATMESATPGVAARLGAVVRRDLRLWLGLVGIVLAYSALHVTFAPITQSTTDSGDEAFELVANFFLRNLLPGLVGGPWTGDVLSGSALVPAAWAVLVALAVVVAWVAFTCRRGGPTARWGWALLLVYAVVDVTLLFGGRSQFGGVLGLVPRYVADMMPVIAIVLAGSVRDLSWAHPGRTARQRRRVLVGSICVGVAYLVSASVTTAFMAPYLFNRDDRAYVETLRRELRNQPRVVVYDGLVPAGVMVGWFGADARVSTVVGGAPENPIFDVASERLRIVDFQGRLRGIGLTDVVRAKRGPSRQCGYNVTAERPTVVPMRSSLSLQKRVMRLGYYTSATDVASVEVGDQKLTVPVAPGLRSIDVVVDAGFDELSIALTQSFGTMCLASVRVGTPEPRSP